MEAADVIGIMAVQNSYGTAIDRRDWAALRRCFTSDAEIIKFGRPPRRGSLEEFLERHCGAGVTASPGRTRAAGRAHA